MVVGNKWATVITEQDVELNTECSGCGELLEIGRHSYAIEGVEGVYCKGCKTFVIDQFIKDHRDWPRLSIIEYLSGITGYTRGAILRHIEGWK